MSMSLNISLGDIKEWVLLTKMKSCTHLFGDEYFQDDCCHGPGDTFDLESRQGEWVDGRAIASVQGQWSWAVGGARTINQFFSSFIKVVKWPGRTWKVFFSRLKISMRWVVWSPFKSSISNLQWISLPASARELAVNCLQSERSMSHLSVFLRAPNTM